MKNAERQIFHPGMYASLFSSLQKAVLVKSREYKTHKEDSQGYIISLAENGFQREISALTLLAGSLNFSNNFHEWVDGRLRALAHRMARVHTADQIAGVWKNMDEHGRFSYLRTVHAMQADIFSDDTLVFTPAPVKLEKLSGRGVIGALRFTGPVLDRNSQPEILVNPSELQSSTSDSATATTVHESLHFILRQLARMCFFGVVPEKHPLYKDAGLILDCVQYDSYTSSAFREAYKADLEERLCFKHEGFTALYKEQSARRRLMTDRVSLQPR